MKSETEGSKDKEEASHKFQRQHATNDPAKPSLKHFFEMWLSHFRQDLPWNKEQYYRKKYKKEHRARRRAKRAKRRERRRAAQDVHVTVQTVSCADGANQSVMTSEKSSLRSPKEENIEEVKDELVEDDNESIVL